ncbi:MAG: aldehyde ferredoxin oxidoreductase C-terminal domain-containing protein, partial [Candidatus Bipolaricaulis sp.]|nr:aldehyde ferredoxin oxidoreductase C-terminal domain-containing protein [Candidatus Bipolaricaulis sp.]
MKPMSGLRTVYLDVDLTRRQVRPLEIPPEWVDLHVGGRGIAGRIVLQDVPPGADPLGPDNIIVFATGPLQGSGLAGAGRYAVAGVSPKTLSLSDSYAGGFFGPALVAAGYDGIIFRGTSSSPVYLTVLEGRAELHDAGELWGKELLETEQSLQRLHGDVRVAAIGPAGENLAIQACVISDRNRAAGRPGFGAVLGAKKLKAVAVGGTKQKPFYDSRALTKVCREFAAELMRSGRQQFLGRNGTAGYLGLHNEKGIQPSRNFIEAVYDEHEKIGGDAVLELLTGRDNCTACPVRCKRVVRTDYRGTPVVPEYGGPEYETLAAFGTLCLNSDLASICLANQRCNALGLDTISAGVSIAFAMEATEAGLLSTPVRWGDSDAILSLIDDIAYRRGLGGELARGIGAVSAELGADFAMLIKGQEIPLHEPRGKKGMALTYTTTPRGGQHMEGIHDDYLEVAPVAPELGVDAPVSRFHWDQRPRLCKLFEDLSSFDNSLILCDFVVNRAGKDYNYPRIREALFAV